MISKVNFYIKTIDSNENLEYTDFIHKLKYIPSMEIITFLRISW